MTVAPWNDDHVRRYRTWKWVVFAALILLILLALTLRGCNSGTPVAESEEDISVLKAINRQLGSVFAGEDRETTDIDEASLDQADSDPGGSNGGDVVQADPTEGDSAESTDTIQDESDEETESDSDPIAASEADSVQNDPDQSDLGDDAPDQDTAESDTTEDNIDADATDDTTVDTETTEPDATDETETDSDQTTNPEAEPADSEAEQAEAETPPTAPLQFDNELDLDIDVFESDTNGDSSGPISLSGRGQPGSTVQLLADADVVAETTVAADGTWQINETVTLAPGQYSTQLRMLDEAGNTLAEAEQAPIEIPEVQTEAVPDLDTEDDPAQRNNVSLSGTAAPNSEVEIQHNGELLDTVTTDADGNWSYEAQLPAGEHELVAVTTTAEGDTIESEPQTVSIAATNLVIIGSNADDGGSPFAGIFGTGEPGIVLKVAEGDYILGTVTAKADGTWRGDCVLPPGEHTLLVTATDDADINSESFTITVPNPAPDYLAVDAPHYPSDRSYKKFHPNQIRHGQRRGNFYVVAPNENMFRVALRLNITLKRLLEYNPQITDETQVYAGQYLNIPQPDVCWNSTYSSVPQYDQDTGTEP